MSTPHNKFAFLIHPRNEIAKDFGAVWRPLGLIPDSWYEFMLGKLPPHPWVITAIRRRDSEEVIGEIISVHLTPKQLLGRDRKLVERHIDAAIKLARKRGATLIGLGALTAPATGGGNQLRGRTEIAVTNGNAYTAVATFKAIEKITTKFETKPTVALVGASGSVGSAVTRLLQQTGIAGELVLIGRTPSNLQKLAAEAPAQQAVVSTDIADCKRAQIVVLMTSATEALLKSEHVAEGAYVLDDTQPRNTSPELLAQRPDITLIDGGLVMTPGLKRSGVNIGIPANMSFACLAETALLALDKHAGHGVIGQPTLEQLNYLSRLADKFSDLGFHLAPPTAFGKEISVPGWEEAVA